MNQPPLHLKSRFPETRWEDLDPHAHRDAFLERILEYGNRDEIKCLIATYGQEAIRNFLRKKGPDGSASDRSTSGAWSGVWIR